MSSYPPSHSHVTRNGETRLTTKAIPPTNQAMFELSCSWQFGQGKRARTAKIESFFSQFGHVVIDEGDIQGSLLFSIAFCVALSDADLVGSIPTEDPRNYARNYAGSAGESCNRDTNDRTLYPRTSPHAERVAPRRRERAGC